MAPEETTTRWRALVATRRRRWVAAGVVAVLVGAGVTWWVFGSRIRGAIPGTVEASVLTAEETSLVLGTSLLAETSASEPPSALTAEPPACSVAVGPATQAVYGTAWTAFRSVAYQDSADVADHTVTQTVARYPEPSDAAAVFRLLADGLANCPAAVRTDPLRGESTWAYEVAASGPESLAWSAIQDAGDGWACHRQARVKGTTVLQVSVCQAGDGAPLAAQLADRVASRVEP